MKTLKALLIIGSITGGMIAAAACSDDAKVTSTTKDSGTEDSGETTDTDSGTTDGGTTDSGPTPLATGQIDRMGRPAINTALVDKMRKQTYNKTSTFAASGNGFTTLPTDIQADFSGHLHALDELGGLPDASVIDWALDDAGVHPLAPALLADALFVDPNKPWADTGTYLDIEFFLLGVSQSYSSCGGRTLNDGVVDKTLSVVVIGGAAPVGDCVNAATKPASTTWPYIAEKN